MNKQHPFMYLPSVKNLQGSGNQWRFVVNKRCFLGHYTQHGLLVASHVADKVTVSAEVLQPMLLLLVALEESADDALLMDAKSWWLWRFYTNSDDPRLLDQKLLLQDVLANVLAHIHKKIAQNLISTSNTALMTWSW